MEPLEQEQVRLAEIETSVASDVVIDGRFRVESVVGAGEMSTVYRAHDLHLDRPVALKVMHRDLVTDKESILRFQREAISATTLEHQNIVKVFSAGVWEGKPYVSMEFIEGETLSQLIKRKERLSPDEVLKIFTQVFDALDCAHQAHVVHRDMKPSNIMLVGPDRNIVKIVDFGIAKILPQSGKGLETLTQTGRIVGSLGYMSPEQCMGFPVDARSDLYSTACVMYEALVGKPAIYGRGYFAIVAKQAACDVKPSEFVDDQFEALILTLMRRDPADRLESAAEAKHALECIAAKKPHGINKPAREEKAATVESARSPRRLAMLSVLCLICILPAAYIWQQWSQTQAEAERLRREQIQERRMREFAHSTFHWEDDGKLFMEPSKISRPPLKEWWAQLKERDATARLDVLRSDLKLGDWRAARDDALVIRMIYDEEVRDSAPNDITRTPLGRLAPADVPVYVAATSMATGRFARDDGRIPSSELLSLARPDEQMEATRLLFELSNLAVCGGGDLLASRMLDTLCRVPGTSYIDADVRNAAVYCRYLAETTRLQKSFRELDACSNRFMIRMSEERITRARAWLAKHDWFDKSATP